MVNRTRLAIGLMGFTLCCGAAVPLVQHLSIAIIQLQIRDRFIDERQSLGQIGHNFDVSPLLLARALGIAMLLPGEENTPLSTIAKNRALAIDVAKARIADAVFPLQFVNRTSVKSNGADTASSRTRH